MRLRLLALWFAAVIVLAACGQTTPDATATPPEPTRDATAQPVIAVAVTATAAATVVPTATHRAGPHAIADSDQDTFSHSHAGPARKGRSLFENRESIPGLGQGTRSGFPCGGQTVSSNTSKASSSRYGHVPIRNRRLARRLLSLSWLTDDITEQEREAVYYLVQLDLAESFARRAGEGDDPGSGACIAEEEWQAISYISAVAVTRCRPRRTLALARRLMDSQPLPIDVEWRRTLQPRQRLPRPS